MGHWLRAATLILAGLGLGVLYLLAGWLEGSARALVDRFGAGPMIAVAGVACVALGLVWLRNGGTQLLRRWGVVLKPAPPGPPRGVKRGRG